MFGLASPRPVRRFVCPPTGAAGGTDFGSLTLPKNCEWVFIWCLGSGAGGGGGLGDIAGNAKGGGSGGSSAGLTKLWIRRRYLPDAVYYLVGWGGVGGAGSSGGAKATDGGGGRLSRVLAYPNIAAENVICISGSTAPAGGPGAPVGGGGPSSPGTPTIASFSDMPLGRAGIADFQNGLSGTAGGGSHLNGGDTSPSATGMFLHGGTGGGGAGGGLTARGGNINAVANTPYLASNGGAAGANPGNPGFRWNGLLYVYGGTGAGGSDSATGANGGGCGANAPGAGGGGGGAGVTTGGRGGDGGPGEIVIECW